MYLIYKTLTIQLSCRWSYMAQIVNKFVLHFRIEFAFSALDLDQYLN